MTYAKVNPKKLSLWVLDSRFYIVERELIWFWISLYILSGFEGCVDWLFPKWLIV